jgi:molybdate transport system substrate-binding protein
MKSSLWLATFALGLSVVVGRLGAEEILVFAAASLTDSLKQIAASYEASTGETVRFNFAASNVLAQQIQAGAPADIFFSADEAKMELLDGGGLIAHETRKDLLGNSLVVITQEGGLKISQVEDLKQPALRHLSLGDPAAVPAGVYAKAWLEKAGLWQVLQPKVVPAENVRAAMAVVESGNAEAGIVYGTDVAISKKVKVAMKIPPEDCPKITYPVAMIKDSRHAEAARRFLVYLAGERAEEAFAKFGFVVGLHH